jgi:hypothetical protein
VEFQLHLEGFCTILIHKATVDGELWMIPASQQLPRNTIFYYSSHREWQFYRQKLEESLFSLFKNFSNFKKTFKL